MSARAIYYDTETTGLRAKEDRIVEIAAYDPEQDRDFVRLINPGVPIPSEASKVHGISDEMVADAPTFEEVGPAFAEFCSGDVILIAHNNDAFDIHFLREEFSRIGLELPKWRFLDTLKWARRYRQDLPRHALQFLREIYGFEANQAHRALDDVIMLHKVFQAMIDDLSIEQAYALLRENSASATLERMPFGKYRDKPFSEVPQSYIDWLKKDGAFDKPENEALKLAFEKAGKL